MQLFTTGLQPSLSLVVEIHNLQSLAVAMSLARKLELWDQCAAPSTTTSRPPQRGLFSTSPMPWPCVCDFGTSATSPNSGGWPTYQTLVVGGDGGTPTPRPLLQLQ